MVMRTHEGNIPERNVQFDDDDPTIYGKNYSEETPWNVVPPVVRNVSYFVERISEIEKLQIDYFVGRIGDVLAC